MFSMEARVRAGVRPLSLRGGRLRGSFSAKKSPSPGERGRDTSIEKQVYQFIHQSIFLFFLGQPDLCQEYQE